jgi:hypothetical protein
VSKTAFNFATNKEYAGSNATLQGNGKYNAFASFNQIASLGYSVNKGAKSVSIFCGYREKTTKNGKTESVPCWGRVFDIVDTNALQDPDLVEFLENGERLPSDMQVNHELVAAMNGGAEAVEQVKQVYSKEVSATEFMRDLGINVVQVA